MAGHYQEVWRAAQEYIREIKTATLIPWIVVTFIVVLHLILHILSKNSESKKKASGRSERPWFPKNVQKEIYYTIKLQCILAMKSETIAIRAPIRVRQAALLRYATETVRRGKLLVSQREAFRKLEESASIGRGIGIYLKKTTLEFMRDMEIVKSEARSMSVGWEETIVRSALNMIDNEELTKRLAQLEAKRKVEQVWWNTRQQNIMHHLLLEVEDDYFDDMLAYQTPPQSSINTRVKNNGKN